MSWRQERQPFALHAVDVLKQGQRFWKGRVSNVLSKALTLLHPLFPLYGSPTQILAHVQVKGPWCAESWLTRQALRTHGGWKLLIHCSGRFGVCEVQLACHHICSYLQTAKCRIWSGTKYRILSPDHNTQGGGYGGTGSNSHDQISKPEWSEHRM